MEMDCSNNSSSFNRFLIRLHTFLCPHFHTNRTKKQPKIDGARAINFLVHISNDIYLEIEKKDLFFCSQVGWVKADSKAIQAIQDVVITYNNRIRVSGDLHTTFNLHIAEIKEEDRGQYMCQINTDPMTFQVHNEYKSSNYSKSTLV